MRRWIFATVLLVFWAAPTVADYNTGFAAYVRGDYAVAIREWLPLAEAGNASAQRNLAVMFRDGRGVEKDLNQALAWLSRAAQAGNASSQYELGKLYERADFPARDRGLALRWFEAAAGQGHANALLTLVELNQETDPDAALRWLVVAADSGVASAQIELGDRYRDGLGVAQDRELARRWYQSAAALGNEDAGARLRSVGTTIALTSRGAVGTVPIQIPAEPNTRPRQEVASTEKSGAVTVQPPSESTVTLQVASADRPSQYVPLPRPKPVRNALSDVLPRFAGPVSKPFAQPIEETEATAVAEVAPVTPALEGGVEAVLVPPAVEVEADSSVAEAPEREPDNPVIAAVADLVKRVVSPAISVEDAPKAVTDVAEPAPALDPGTAFASALDAYALGDYARAVEIWKILAKEGLAEAQSNLGAMYDKGLFVPQDFSRAVELFQAAAEQGLASAQFNLGIMYAEGRGTLKDTKAAAEWHRLAAEQGHPLATEYLAALVRADQARAQEREVAQVPAVEVHEPEPVNESVVAAVPPETVQPASISDDSALRVPAVATDTGGGSVASLTVTEAEKTLGSELAYSSGLAAFAAGDYVGAVRIWEPMAEGGHLSAMFGLGLMLDQGLGVLPDADRARQLLTAAADRGHPDARHYLTMSREIGAGDGDLSRAAELVRQTTRGILVGAENKLATFSGFALAGTETYPAWKFWVRRVVGYVWQPWAKFDEARDAYRDRLYVQSFNAWREVALDGDSAAQNNVGVMYANGQGTGPDLIAAAGWFQRAAQQGEPVAILNQGLAGLARNDSDPQAVVGLFRQAAALGVPAATYNLGAAYADGFGVPQSMNEAALAFRAAADRGDALAIHNLAVMYERGISFPQNMAEALGLYRSAADRGEARAQVALGLHYAKGDGVIQNNRAAADLFRPAAEAGDPVAQHNLGVLYAFGYSGDLIYGFNDGVAEDLAQAQYWFTRAAAGGVAESLDRLDVLSLRLGDQDRARADRLIEQSRLETLLN